MAIELNPLYLNQLNKLGSTPGTWMWNSRRVTAKEDDSWEVRAFAEDTANIMGTTWPPRSYTCTFCRREFRSAQALGGHMNVHRRDRARLRQSPPVPDPSSSSPSSPLIFPSHDFVASGGLCLLYPFPSQGTAVFSPASVSAYMDSPSTLLSISPYHHNNLNFPTATSMDTSPCHLGKLESTVPIDQNSSNNNNNNINDNDNKDTTVIEELDLELRLGQRPQPH